MDSTRRERIRAEQLRLAYHQTPPLILGSILGGSLLTYVLWGSVSSSALILWISAVFITSLARLVLWKSYQRSHRPAERHAFWSISHVITTLGTTCVWGLVSLLFYPYVPPGHQFIIACLLIGAGGSTLAFSAFPASFYAGVIPIMLPLATVSFALGESQQTIVGMLSILFTIMLLGFRKNISASILSALELGLENEALVRELRLQKDEAEKANADKSRFLAATSHDLRQPFQALELFVEALNTRIPSDGEAAQIIKKIQASLKSLDSMFNGLLDISKLDAAGIQPNLHSFMLAPFLQRLHADFLPLAEEKGLQLHLGGIETRVKTDPVLLERIVRNLLSNAIRHTGQGRVFLACRRRGINCRIEVRDSGPGFDMKETESLFTEFFQLENPARDHRKGTGLGLAIVQRLARLLDHRIDVRSIPGRGSVFSIEVPIDQAPVLSTEASRFKPQTPAGANHQFEGFRAMIIDDDPAILDGMQQLLGDWGFQVSAFSGSEAALKAIKLPAGQPQVVISDFRLPGIKNGLQLIKEIQSMIESGTPAILITGDLSPLTPGQALPNDCFILQKPLQPARLRSLLQHLLRSKKPPGS